MGSVKINEYLSPPKNIATFDPRDAVRYGWLNDQLCKDPDMLLVHIDISIFAIIFIVIFFVTVDILFWKEVTVPFLISLFILFASKESHLDILFWKEVTVEFAGFCAAGWELTANLYFCSWVFVSSGFEWSYHFDLNEYIILIWMIILFRF